MPPSLVSGHTFYSHFNKHSLSPPRQHSISLFRVEAKLLCVEKLCFKLIINADFLIFIVFDM
jgi:hypothetical protein